MQSDKLRILFLITGMVSGGAERVMANLSNGLQKKGHKIRIVVMKKAETDYYLDDSIEFVGADAVDKKGNNKFFKGLFFYIKNVKEYKPDIIVSFLPKTNIIAMACRLVVLKNPVITCERADPMARKGIIKALNNYMFPLADGCAFQTRMAREYYKIKDSSKTAVLNNPLDCSFNIKPYSGKRKKEIVAVGRLSEQKNHKLLIDAFFKISKKYPDYCLKIYGDGLLEAKLKRHISNLKLSDRVYLLGRVNDVKEAIYESALFVLSSNFEGMPNALLEAMSIGLPCISTDCRVGGPSELIENRENGILVPVGDADKMAEMIDTLLSDYYLADKISQNANKIYERFSMKNVIDEWENFIYKIYNKWNKKYLNERTDNSNT